MLSIAQLEILRKEAIEEVIQWGETQIDTALMDAARQGKTAAFCTIQYTNDKDKIVSAEKFVKEIKERYTKARYRIDHRYRVSKNEEGGKGITFDIYWEY